MNKGLILILIGIASLAMGGIFVKFSEVGPIATAVYRILFAMPLAFMWAKKTTKVHINIGLKEMFILQIAGIFLAFDLILWHWSFHLTSVANANLLGNLIPFTVIPLSVILFKEKINKNFFFALLISIIGLIILMSNKKTPSMNSFEGDILAILTSFFYGLYFLCVRYLRSYRSYSTGFILYYSGFGSLLVLIPTSLIFEDKIIPSSLFGISILFLLAVLSHILGQGLVAEGLKYTKSAIASILVLLQPIFAGIYAYIFFRETLSIFEVLGISIVLIGIYLAKKFI